VPCEAGAVNNTYRSIRLIGPDYNLYYSVWCSNEHELYDMKTDPFQMTNLFSAGFDTNKCGSSSSKLTTARPMGVSPRRLAARLDAMLLVLKTCVGDSCRQPWETLLPGQGLKTIKDALQAKYDAFFAGVPRVSWTSCQAGYLPAAEGVQYEAWAGGRLETTRDDGGDPEWAMWV
jgi:N-acetylglucosamine-6-sulfatase